MKGLLIKEKYLMWHNCKVYLLIPLFYFAVIMIGVFSHRRELDYFPMGIVFLFMGIIPVNTCNVEIQSRWHNYSMTMPYSRSMMVSSKYIASLIIIALTTVMCTGLVGIAVLFGGETQNLLQNMFMGIGMAFSPTIIFFPLHFKFYSTMGGVRLLFSGLVGGLIGGMNIFFINFAENANTVLTSSMLIFMAVMIVLFGLSWLISLAIFKGKDV